MRRKFDYSYVKRYIEEEKHPGSKLLSNNYKNLKTKLKLVCEYGHEFEMDFEHVLRNQWCSLENGGKKLSFNYVKDFIENKHPGCKLLSNDYTNSSTKLNLLCENGHNFKAPFKSIQQNKWCNICYKERFAYDKIKNNIENKHLGCKLLSNNYINNLTKLNLLCENGHNFKMTLNNINSNHWCSICVNNKKYTLDEVKSYINNKHPKAKLLSTKYINNQSKLDLICENGHFFSCSFSQIKSTGWCKFCKINKGEEIVRSFLEKLYNKKFIKIKPNWLINPKTNQKLELDGYCKELKLAFEYQGKQHYKFPNLYHKTKNDFLIQKERDEIKYKICLNYNIKIFYVKEFCRFNKKKILDRLLPLSKQLNIDNSKIESIVEYLLKTSQ